MAKVIIESEGIDPPVRVTVIDFSDVDTLYTLTCSGDGRDECPTNGFEPGDTWAYDYEGCVDAGQAHVRAHERRAGR